jgi:hypothetical protein
MKNAILPAKTEKIRMIQLLSLSLIIISLGSPHAFALDLMGPPSAEIEKGMFRAGAEYSFSKIDLDLIEGKATVFQNLAFLDSGPYDSLTIDNLKVNTLYATIGYGILENYEVFLRMGTAHAEFGDSLWDDGEDFDSNNNFAIGGGFKATFYKGFDWKVGGVFQVDWADLDGEVKSSSWTVPQPELVDISSTEMQIALGVTYLWSSRVSVYGGPFVHFISGDFDLKFTRIFDSTFYTGKFSWQFNEGPTYGGYIGAQIKLLDNSYANVEYQQTSDAEFYGAGLMFKF